MNVEDVIDQGKETNLKDRKTAFLIGTCRSGSERIKAEEHLEELERLCDTFGLSVVWKSVSQIKKIDAGVYLGKGKIEELSLKMEELQAGVVIFDDEISPNQQKNLEALFKRSVIDRTELIIEVFAQKAKTKEARLQIELAKIKYQAPRLKRMWTHLSRQSSGGGGHVKGEGEKQIEIDRRILKKKIDHLKQEIKEVVAIRDTQRVARKRSGIPTFAIVGYTNAGKSTLMKALTGAEVLVEDKLFATLDTTTRKFMLPNHQEILLVDTVGFIRKIPHTLITAFKSTLEEAVFTDVLIHLIDVSHPQAEEQTQEALAVLKELGATKHPMITVLNKIDVCESPSLIQKFKLAFPKTVAISATTGQGFEELVERMIEEISSLRTVVRLRIPQNRYDLVTDLMQEGHVLLVDYEENDVLLSIEIPKHLEYKVQEFRLL